MLSLANLANGQDRTISIGTIGRGDSQSAVLAPTVEYIYNKHTVLLGYDVANKQGYLITGYRYTPKDSIEKKLRLYFPVDILFRSIKSHRFNDQNDLNNHTINTQLAIGYGFKYNFLKGLYVNSQSGLGIHYTFQDHYGIKDGASYAYKFNTYDLIWFFQIGLGYDLKFR